MIKVQQTEKRKDKQSVALSAMFSNPKTSILRQKTTDQSHLTAQRPIKVTRGKNLSRLEIATERPLAAGFPDCLEQSRRHIQEKTDVDLETTRAHLLQRLSESSSDICLAQQQAKHANEVMTKPLETQMFDWTMNDGTRSGNAVLGQRLKKFKKIIVTEEKEIEHQIAEWSKANSQIRQLAAELVSQDGLGHVVAEQTSRTTPIGEQRQQKDAASEVEAEKARLKMQIEKESISSARVMRESEKQLKLKQNQMEQYLFAMFRDDED